MFKSIVALWSETKKWFHLNLNTIAEFPKLEIAFDIKYALLLCILKKKKCISSMRTLLLEQDKQIIGFVEFLWLFQKIMTLLKLKEDVFKFWQFGSSKCEDKLWLQYKYYQFSLKKKYVICLLDGKSTRRNRLLSKKLIFHFFWSD